MTKQQRAEAVKVILNDATLQGDYINVRGDMCVIGGLAHAAGVSEDTLREAAGSIQIGNWTLVKAIKEKFGLDERAMMDLQRINDEIGDTIQRRAKLIERLHEWEAQ
jgi:hypothetical protein